MIPTATYRLQLHANFPFSSAEAVVPYLQELGISHVYSSPITVARSGSTHGYDVVDPTRVNPELGGEDGLRSLVDALRSRGMGLVIDIVPNHMGVAGGENAWWNDVLKHGHASRFARYFDIDWSSKLLLPILGAPLERGLAAGDVEVDADGVGEARLVLYGEHRLPLRPDDHHALPRAGDVQGLAALLERQHYRLGWWRVADDELNWRRFFTINELAGLRIEDPEVFEATHALYFRLYGEGLIDGVRVDHVDGLTDPGDYCRRLRARFDAIDGSTADASRRAWIVVEKILGAGERLASNWGIDGTSGYDFMEEASGLLHDPSGEGAMTTLWREFSGRSGLFADEELRARQDMLAWAFESQFRTCVDAFARLARSREESASWTRGMLKRALASLLWVFPVYRNYGPADEVDGHAQMMQEVAVAARQFLHPADRPVVDRVTGWLTELTTVDAVLAEARRRFQQLSAPIAAKAVEDTAFYRYGALLSRTDVGFDARTFALAPVDFHHACDRRAHAFPAAMVTTATHDHKRGEDVRARLAVLSAVPDEWAHAVQNWDLTATAESSEVDPADRYVLYQTLYGAWPAGLDPGDTAGLAEFAERVSSWHEKALREAKLRSSWEVPDLAYEQSCRDLVTRLLDPLASAEFISAVHRFVGRTQAAATANSLVQVALRCLVPGVPDMYQGTELQDLSLVDPDNRRAVDFRLRAELLARGTEHEPKLGLLHQLLTLRRQNADLFLTGDYRPVRVRGPRAGHIFAFTRNTHDRTLVCAVTLRTGRQLLDRDEPVPAPSWWEGTSIEHAAHEISAERIFGSSPVFVELRT